AWIRLSSTVGTRSTPFGFTARAPSWNTSTHVALSGEYCDGTYTQYCRTVPSNTLLLKSVGPIRLPLGTPSFGSESEPSLDSDWAQSEPGKSRSRKSGRAFTANGLRWCGGCVRAEVYTQTGSGGIVFPTPGKPGYNPTTPTAHQVNHDPSIPPAAFPRRRSRT